MAREVGIVIRTKDKASKAIKATGAAARKSGAALKAMGTLGVSAFKAVGFAVVSFNQGLELAKKGLELFKATIGAAITKSLEFRRETDKTVVFFKNLRRESELVAARFGDALLPVFQGFIEATTKAGGKVSDLIEENRKLIGMGLIAFIKSTALGLVKVARAIIFVVDAWHELTSIVSFVELIINKFFQGFLLGHALMMTAVIKLKSAFGFDTAKLESARDSVRGLADEFGRSADKANEMVLSSQAAIGEFEKTVNAIEENIVKVIDDGTARATKLLEKSTAGMKKNADEFAALEEKKKAAALAAIKAIETARLEAIETKRAAEFAQSEAFYAQLEAQQQRAADVAMQFAVVFSTAFESIIAGTGSLVDVFRRAMGAIFKMAIDLAVKQITINAGVTATEGAKAVAGIPIIGPALAVVAAATMSALVMSYMSKFAAGGEVTGGVQGRDSVAALLTPGERVLTVDENRTLSRLMRSVSQPRPGRNTSGVPAFRGGGIVQQSGDGGGGGNVTIHFSPTVSTVEIPDRQRLREMLLSWGDELDDLVGDGLMLRGVQRA